MKEKNPVSTKRLKKLFLTYFNLRSIIIFVMPLSIVVLLFMLYNLSVTVENLSVSLIQQTIVKTETELNGFFQPVSEDVKITSERGKTGIFNSMNPEILNPFFIPYIRNSKQVSSILLGNANGDEFLLLEEDTNWQNRLTTFRGGKRNVERKRWKYNQEQLLTLTESWTQEKDSANNPIKKPWYQTAINNPKPEQTIWTPPYIFKTTKDLGITASIRWIDESKTDWVIACDVMLMDISIFTSSLQVSQNGLAFVMTDSMKMIGLPKNIKFNSTDSLKKYVLQNAEFVGDSTIVESLKSWEAEGKKTNIAYSFKLNNENWWCEIKPYTGCHGNTFYICVLVPEKDFMQEVKKTRTVFIGGFLLVLILTLLVIRGYNQKRKANILLAKQKAEIERQRNEIQDQKEHIEEIHKELKSSIHYAERIQKAVLPKEEILKKYLKDYFILFKPRDIVSGDFYWMFGKDEYLVVTVADCTGHGVPGAFMSMLGVSFLSEIVGVRNIFNAAEILNTLRNKIITTLEQKGALGEQKDGMDMALVVINSKTGKLHFAGANNPLLLISRANSSEVQVFKADKMPVAISDGMQDFKQIEIDFETGDQVYMFSDGFADQFGGPNGKKFMLKQLREIIQENSSLSSAEQKEILNNAIENWKSFIDSDTNTNFSQIDDITLIGLALQKFS